ncbi:MAG: zf-HC2 domain-containing protein [Deltaproteobacteria bacterium]|nr:zf-HC2 domain-containing protein [Deltaproteobacteria bacterium]
MSAIALGGPGVGCSATRVRRLLAGELAGAERTRVEEHLASCGRCQATREELAEEERQLVRSLTFERFAAGVAERMAAPAETAAAPWMHLVPLALAATLLVALALPFLGRRGAGPEEPYRTKGGAGLVLHADASGGARALQPGEPVPEVPLRAELHPGAWREAALLLRDEDGVATLYAGPARPGPVPGAFQWTGRRGELWLLLSDAPLSEAERQALLAGAAPGGRAEIVWLPLARAVSR